ncbi:MAG: site-2 protease family protein [Clostridiales bacterium]|jgi:regulator of sigma E protease|nr:site-2 protease family protein [Clostridiales bacterium]
MEPLIFISYILLAIVILLVMVVIHELGHYLAGKLLKFKINEFSVGFGPKLLQRIGKKSGEKFTLRAIPLGGYCAFEDEAGLADAAKTAPPVSGAADGAEAVPDVTEIPISRSFVAEKPWKRILVLVAGGVFNLVSAVVFSFIFILAAGYQTPVIGEVYKNSGGDFYNAEIRVGDEIIGLDGKRIGVMHHYSELLAGYELGDSCEFLVLRDGRERSVRAKKQVIVYTDKNGEERTYDGFGFQQEEVMRSHSGSFLDAVKWCVPFAGKLSWTIIGAFGKMITGRVPVTEISGPIGTVTAMAEVSMMDWRNILLLLPLIASNLGIFNLLPIPALDGSKAVFTAVEWIRKKPVNRNVESMIHTVGLLLLFGFVIAVDIIGLVLRWRG